MDFKSELFKRDRVLNTFSLFGYVYLTRNGAFSGNMPKKSVYHACSNNLAFNRGVT